MSPRSGLALLVGAAAACIALPLVAFVACAVIGWLALTFALMTPVRRALAAVRL